jgi:hypothetical protein
MHNEFWLDVACSMILVCGGEPSSSGLKNSIIAARQQTLINPSDGSSIPTAT